MGQTPSNVKKEHEELGGSTHCTSSTRRALVERSHSSPDPRPSFARYSLLHLLVLLLVDMREIKALFKQFKRENPSGQVTRTEFNEVMEQMGLVDPFLQERIFRIFDANNDGVISFQEFVVAWSVMSRGTPSEKLDRTCACQAREIPHDTRTHSLTCALVRSFV